MCVGFFLILFQSASAQVGGVKGTITGKNGRALPNATIFIEGKTTSCISDQNGHYSMPLRPGHYHLLVAYSGLAPQRATISVVFGVMTHQDFILWDIADLRSLVALPRPSWREARRRLLDGPALKMASPRETKPCWPVTTMKLMNVSSPAVPSVLRVSSIGTDRKDDAVRQDLSCETVFPIPSVRRLSVWY